MQNENTIYVTSLDSLHDASASWRKIADVGDEVTGFDIHGDHVYLLSHHEASRFKILGVDLPKDEVAHARVVMAPSDAVVTGIQAAADALYVQKLDGGLGKFAAVHRDIVAKFGRFPHRNHALGRATTSAEQDFLDAGGFAG